MVPLQLTPEVLQAVRSHAEAAYPHECVGALFSDATGVVDARPLINEARDPRARFQVSAKGYLAAEAHAATRGLTLHGLYHSHPDAPAQPSVSDLATAAPGLWTFIIPVAQGVAQEPRAWWFEPHLGGFIEGSAP